MNPVDCVCVLFELFFMFLYVDCVPCSCQSSVFILQLTFEEDLAITKMKSGEGELVPFSETLYPRGNVEDWLLEVERVMRGSLRKIIGDSLLDYPKVCLSISLIVGNIYIHVCIMPNFHRSLE